MSDSLHIIEDEQLYGFVKEGDRAAYTELYERYKRPLLAFALKKVKPDEAEDIVHDLFVKLWSNRDTIQLQGHFVGYIFTALRNKIIDHMARVSQSQQYIASLESYVEQEAASATDHKLREKLFWKSIEDVLDQYSPRAQAIVRMRMEGYSNQEIADQLNLSEKTIRNQQSSIIKYLRSKFPYIITWYFIFFLFL
ncbi:MAG: sigma-70 family polymerase sigma factor [Sphingobacterium sp.]|jgi:RNA polymerase sigma-70 factor (ECF subfamily)|nr:sigma-70 family polymerase sigma factor [Sphingobacterium sp.]